MDHKWGVGLHHPYRLGDPQRFIAGGGNRQWPTSGADRLHQPSLSQGFQRFIAAEKMRSGPEPEKWALWLHHPCPLGHAQRL